jgi:hypothetical protein
MVKVDELELVRFTSVAVDQPPIAAAAGAVYVPAAKLT